jgi:hypothetical protein
MHQRDESGQRGPEFAVAGLQPDEPEYAVCSGDSRASGSAATRELNGHTRKDGAGRVDDPAFNRGRAGRLADCRRDRSEKEKGESERNERADG